LAVINAIMKQSLIIKAYHEIGSTKLQESKLHSGLLVVLNVITEVHPAVQCRLLIQQSTTFAKLARYYQWLKCGGSVGITDPILLTILNARSLSRGLFLHIQIPFGAL